MIDADRERKARHDQQRPTARQRGYDSKWEKARAEYLAANPRCFMCGQPSRVVDHKTPHKGNRKLFWQRSNWQSLCTPCHSSKKQSMEARQ
ncbi:MULTISPECIES: HNH endonuclease signature motif containing protein [Chelativorans]|jgi:5-methylcytosine-specific restriction endonuclease McrA